MGRGALAVLALTAAMVGCGTEAGNDYRPRIRASIEAEWKRADEGARVRWCAMAERPDQVARSSYGSGMTHDEMLTYVDEFVALADRECEP